MVSGHKTPSCWHKIVIANKHSFSPCETTYEVKKKLHRCRTQNIKTCVRSTANVSKRNGLDAVEVRATKSLNIWRSGSLFHFFLPVCRFRSIRLAVQRFPYFSSRVYQCRVFSSVGVQWTTVRHFVL